MQLSLLFFLILLISFFIFLIFYTIYSIIFQKRWFMYLLHKITPNTLLYFKTTERKVVLTIDDGPTSHTEEILNLLHQYNVHATFFLIGNRVNGREEIIQRIISDGHEIGNHIWNDEPSFKNTPEEFEENVQRTHSVLLPYLSHQKYLWFRPGSGIPMEFMIDSLKKLKYIMTVGSMHAFDAQITNCSITSFWLKHGIEFGDICIVHDRSYTLPEIESFIQYCLKYDIQIVSLGEMMDCKNCIPCNQTYISSIAIDSLM